MGMLSSFPREDVGVHFFVMSRRALIIDNAWPREPIQNIA